jgi:Tol biopolymer transport system component
MPTVKNLDTSPPRRGVVCLSIPVILAFATFAALPASAHAGPKAAGQDSKKEDRKEEKKGEPFEIKRLTQSMGLYAMGPVSPDGQSVLLLAQKPDKAPNLYVMNLADHSIRPPLTNLKWGVSDPSWSPDSQSVAFAGFGETASFPEVYVLDLKTVKLRQLTHNAFSDKEPVFTPDGKRLLFTSDESPLPDAAFGILHIASVSIGGGKPEYFTEDEVSSIRPGISNDGKTVLLLKISEASGRHSLWEYSLDGKPMRDLTETRFARIHRYIVSGPYIILWAQEEAERQDAIYILDPKTREIRDLPDPDLRKRTPSVSPDGKLIVFIGLGRVGAHVFLFDTVTGELKQLTNKGFNNYSPVFASNSLILFGSDRDKEQEIYQIDLSKPSDDKKKK